MRVQGSCVESGSPRQERPRRAIEVVLGMSIMRSGTFPSQGFTAALMFGMDTFQATAPPHPKHMTPLGGPHRPRAPPWESFASKPLASAQGPAPR